MNVRRASELTEPQVKRLWELYQDEWWTRGRTLEDVQKMVENSSLVFGFIAGNEELVGFARVLSDRVYKAFIFDVVVAPDSRKTGLGADLMNWILSTPELSSVRHFELYCAPEMRPFYERWGFSLDVGEVSLMRRAA